MFLIIIIIILIFAGVGFTQQLEVESPGKILKVIFELKDGEAFYSIERSGSIVIEESRLGYRFVNPPHLDKGFSIVNWEQSSTDEVWTQPWGEVKQITDNHNQLLITLQTTEKLLLNIFFKVFDDGVGFRYEIPRQEQLSSLQIMEELSEFAFTGNHSAWWIGAYQWNRYEYLYTNSNLQSADTVHTPFTLTTGEVHLSIHEAALFDYPSMALRRSSGNKYQADLFPWSDGIRVKGEAPMLSPWRTIQIEENAGSLLTNYLILNLNEPNKLGDVSWVRPAKYVGIWWEMHIGKATWGSGVKHGATTNNAKKYIDFAAKHRFDGVLIEGWNETWDGDWVANGEIFNFTKPYPDFDIQEVTAYAKSKGVKVIGHHETGAAVLNYENQLSDALDYYRALGINTIKTGYVNHGQNIKRVDEKGDTVKEWHHGQFMVRHYKKVIEEAAKRQIMLNVHEPIKPTGEQRTFPNMMTREGARGQEYDAWDERGGNPPQHTVIIPFTRLLAGPMDFTPGIFNLTFDSTGRNRVNGTLARQLAHYVMIYSPLHMAADLPENYEKNLEPFRFIKDVPVDWDETIVLNAEIGKYLTIVRKERDGENWYLGSGTNDEKRSFSITLDFLNEGENYKAEVYADGEESDWRTNPYSIEISERMVRKGDSLEINLASGGGAAIRFLLVR